MDTEFQRAAGVWDKGRQSRLIESILIRFPLPAFYFDSSNDKQWLIVDGLQRIFTIKNFVNDDKLALEGLEFLNNPTFTGKKYSELPRDFQRRIKETKITAYLIKATTPDEVKFNLFKRINTGGLSLKPQEIRHALNQGTSANLVRDLANINEFKLATAFSVSPKRMDDRDYATRFLAFYLTTFEDYQPDLDSFLNLQMAKVKGYSTQQLEIILADFQRALAAAYEIWGKFAFRKQINFNERRRPINKALFEVITSQFAHLSDKESRYLVENKEKVKQALATKLNEDGRFFSSLTVATGAKGTVATRHRGFNTLIKGILNQLR